MLRCDLVRPQIKQADWERHTGMDWISEPWMPYLTQSSADMQTQAPKPWGARSTGNSSKCSTSIQQCKTHDWICRLKLRESNHFERTLETLSGRLWTLQEGLIWFWQCRNWTNPHSMSAICCLLTREPNNCVQTVGRPTRWESIYSMHFYFFQTFSSMMDYRVLQ